MRGSTTAPRGVGAPHRYTGVGLKSLTAVVGSWPSPREAGSLSAWAWSELASTAPARRSRTCPSRASRASRRSLCRASSSPRAPMTSSAATSVEAPWVVGAGVDDWTRSIATASWASIRPKRASRCANRGSKKPRNSLTNGHSRNRATRLMMGLGVASSALGVSTSASLLVRSMSRQMLSVPPLIAPR